jgi:malate dehydrogenase
MQTVILHLLDIAPMMSVLQGVVMEIEDTSLPLVKGKSFQLTLTDEH